MTETYVETVEVSVRSAASLKQKVYNYIKSRREKNVCVIFIFFRTRDVLSKMIRLCRQMENFMKSEKSWRKHRLPVWTVLKHGASILGNFTLQCSGRKCALFTPLHLFVKDCRGSAVCWLS